MGRDQIERGGEESEGEDRRGQPDERKRDEAKFAPLFA